MRGATGQRSTNPCRGTRHSFTRPYLCRYQIHSFHLCLQILKQSSIRNAVGDAGLKKIAKAMAKLRGLAIKKSNVLGGLKAIRPHAAGLGVFATRHFKAGAPVTFAWGEFFQKLPSSMFFPHGWVGLSENSHLWAKKHGEDDDGDEGDDALPNQCNLLMDKRCPAKYINDANGPIHLRKKKERQESNVALQERPLQYVMSDYRYLVVKVTRDIQQGDELVLDYGEEYW